MRTLIGVSVFWFALSILFDGINTLILPVKILGIAPDTNQPTILGVLSFFGLVAGMLIQPLAGAWSDNLRYRIGRKPFIAAGLVITLIAITFFGYAWDLTFVFVGYLFIQLASSFSQAAQQGFIPDLIPPNRRGVASGLKGFLDIAGSMTGFFVLGHILGSRSLNGALALIAGTLVLGYLITAIFVRETRGSRDVVGSSLNLQTNRVGLNTAFRLDLRQNSRFLWVVTSRFLFLTATYAVGRFILFFVADRLQLNPTEAAEKSGLLLGYLALVTVIASLPAGWAADRWGRISMMAVGAILSSISAVLLIFSSSMFQIGLFGSLMSLGSASFAGANWALTADLAPAREGARYFGLANIGTAGAAATAGLLGPVIDQTNRIFPGSGYRILFLLVSVIFMGSLLSIQGVRSQQVDNLPEGKSFPPTNK